MGAGAVQPGDHTRRAEVCLVRLGAGCAVRHLPTLGHSRCGVGAAGVRGWHPGPEGPCPLRKQGKGAPELPSHTRPTCAWWLACSLSCPPISWKLSG